MPTLRAILRGLLAEDHYHVCNATAAKPEHQRRVCIGSVLFMEKSGSGTHNQAWRMGVALGLWPARHARSRLAGIAASADDLLAHHERLNAFVSDELLLLTRQRQSGIGG